MQYQGKLMIETQENGEKKHFGTDLGILGLNSGGQFFLKSLASSVNGYNGQLSPHTISEKTNDPIA